MYILNKKERFYKLLEENEFVFLDGGMGTMLQKSGLKTGEVPELLNLDRPDLITSVHKAYVDAGSQIVYANTFGANSYKMAETGKTVDELISAAIKNARKAAGDKALVALDVGPIGQLLEPTGTLKFEEAYDYFKEEMLAGKDADVIVIETMTDLYEAKAALLAAKENTDLPVIVTMTFEQNLRTFTGCSVGAMALTLEGLGADAVGVNCSLGPREFAPIIEELSKWTKLPIVAKPNAGLPNPVTNEYDVTPEEFAESAAKLVKYGIKLTGGCCGTNPDYIRALKKALEPLKYEKNTPMCEAAVCSAEKVVVINQPRIIGERINPTGKKLFKEALRKGDIDYILGQAIEQSQAGAEILDVNVGLPEIDEKAMMVRTVKALQGVTDLPLQIDSTIPKVIEAALRVYNGKAIVNSVNGEAGSMEKILPIVKKYGAAVVGLTLDEDGIPKTAEKRFQIAERIMNKAIEMGIPKKDIFIDCLTLTASAEQANVMKTVEALHRVKTELGLKTVLGVSNISFGLPNRELINCNFLQMCLTNGLDLPIMNPNVASMTGAVRAYRLLTAIDVNSVEFIAAYAGEKTPPSPIPKAAGGETHDLMYCVKNGLKAEGAKVTEELLQTTNSMEIVDNILIPALDKIGEDFEKGIIFLPQLIMSAGVAQAAFEVIRNNMIMNNSAPVVKGKVVLATVKGDIHDIGKNIVKVLLENYGYEVIDLGRDVDYQAVVDAAIENKVKLVGLSALMTTTLCSMEATVKLLREQYPDCKVVVGGAVLTPEYAESIGADFYAKDAKETVDVAKRIYG